MLHSDTTDLNGPQLFYAEALGAGPALVLLHGITDSHAAFLPLLPAPVQRAHVYPSDLRGHNLSGHVPGADQVQDYGSDILALVEQVVGRPADRGRDQDGDREAGERAGAHVAQTVPVVEGQPPAFLADYFIALNQREEFIAAWERFLAAWDVFLCPVGRGSAPLRDDTTVAVDGAPLPEDLQVHPSIVIALTGQPAISMPLMLDRSRIPLGALLVSRQWSDENLLAIAEIVSHMTGGFRRPVYCHTPRV